MEIAFFNDKVSSIYIFELLGKEKNLNVNFHHELDVCGVCDMREGGDNCLAFSVNIELNEVERKLNKCIVITEDDVLEASGRNIYITVSDARAVFIKLLAQLNEHIGVKPWTSKMDSVIEISPHANVSPQAIIEAGVKIGDGAIISSGCVIKSGSQIGRNTTIRENCIIGCDGITIYKSKNGEILKFPHVCGVIIGENTEVGAGCIIPKGILSSTIIGDDVVIGNLCNIGHGATLADNVWMSVGTLIGGHTHIGRKATIGMGSRVRDNLVIGENSSIGMGSVVVKSVDSGISVFGNPAKRMPGLSTGPKR